MNAKFLIALAAILALAQVEAQGGMWESYYSFVLCVLNILNPSPCSQLSLQQVSWLIQALQYMSFFKKKNPTFIRIESISSSVTGAGRTPLLSSASSAYSRISAGLASSAATASATQASSISSGSASASVVSSSAASVQNSASSVLSSLTSTASALAQSNAPNAANSMVAGNNYLLQLSALAALFIASFVAILA